MKIREIAAQYNIDPGALERFVKQAQIPYKSGISGMILDDGHDMNAFMLGFNQFYVSEQQMRATEVKAAQDYQEAIQKAAKDKQTALAKMLITSGFNFDGYTITKYSGYISGDDAIQIDRGTQGIFSRATNVGDSLMASLVHIRRNALAELKEAAFALGCNAVIGVDFDYLTLDPETSGGYFKEHRTEYLPYVFGVTANGNAVIIEKNK